MYSVTKFFGRSEMREKNFSNLHDARKFIQEKLLQDIDHKIKATYRIYEGADFIEEITQKDAVQPHSSSSDSGSASSSGSKGSKQVFSPTPLSTRPRPGGIPQNWKDVKDEDDKEK